MPPKDAKETGKIIGEKSENHMALRFGLLIPKDGVEPPQEQAYSFHHVMVQLEEMMGKLKTMEDKQENLVIEQRRIDAAIQRIGAAPRGQGLAPIGQLPRPQDEAPLGVVNMQERQVDPPLPPPEEEVVDVVEDVAQVDARNINVMCRHLLVLGMETGIMATGIMAMTIGMASSATLPEHREQKAKGIARSDEEMPPPKERRPSIPVRNGYINRVVPSRGQVVQPMAPRPVALTGSMPRSKLDLTTTEDMPMRVPNRSVTWKTVQRKLDFSSEDAKPSMMITSTVQGTSMPMMTRSKITASAPHNAAMEEEVTALTTILEKCNFKKDAEEVVPEGIFKVTDDMTFEYLVG
ncbi:hypothetical protein COLO4_12793 [Corchorus olitorius]|uniref:Uncharacterized protein n=1 Tax=Corchorus olitorius TaxID=93759 RepID=A0A1R3JZL7_9ROSI|nr:hypothetical protein COLO4_12793 [Corchorus olitorius]